MKKAQSQVNQTKEKVNLDAPIDMPIPPTMSAEKALPEEAVSTQNSIKTPQELDPSIKFLNNEGFVYDPVGRRDPFKSFISVSVTETGTIIETAPKSSMPSFLLRPNEGIGDTLEASDTGAFKLVGILWNVHDPKAMLRSPGGKVFMVRLKSRVGRNNGYVAAIREGEVVVVELMNDAKTPTTRVLSLQK